MWKGLFKLDTVTLDVIASVIVLRGLKVAALLHV